MAGSGPWTTHSNKHRNAGGGPAVDGRDSTSRIVWERMRVMRGLKAAQKPRLFQQKNRPSQASGWSADLSSGCRQIWPSRRAGPLDGGVGQQEGGRAKKQDVDEDAAPGVAIAVVSLTLFKSVRPAREDGGGGGGGQEQVKQEHSAPELLLGGVRRGLLVDNSGGCCLSYSHYLAGLCLLSPHWGSSFLNLSSITPKLMQRAGGVQ
ncbi:hypothetical protein PTTG_07415 [Puccinia triticina 1-1 BBBD Race 1]|uniref:Uncharacterized protein n=1 Tax=Puccinia triticina (isolate 1-1 / race 1 (BBBD)) TaxID=630390 RepID=A0A0C4F2U4_PUCT1|nr:hypothetical protein PTTG_07415 [Puccinia triticina 1-1 BBBD Race 1]